MSRLRRRRTVVRTACVVLAGSVAGCLDDSDGGDTEQPEATTESTDTPAATTESPETTAATTTDPDTETGEQPTVEEFLSATDNFDGIEDRTGTATVDVKVGVEANGAFFGFGPPAVRVDGGTTVTWTWTGQGGPHNVVARHGAEFESEQTSEEGHTFQRIFDEPGTVLYVCSPHEGTGMKGAIVVE